jgi:site-specific recombinase XerC
MEADAMAFDEALGRNSRGRPRVAEKSRELTPLQRRASGDGVYAYTTAGGVRWRFSFRQSDGSLSSRRGFTSRRAASAERRRVVESVRRRELTVSRATFDAFWQRVLAEKRPFMTSGSHQDFATHGRKRLLPFFGQDRLSAIDEDRVRAWLETMVDAGTLAPKTVNNARTCLSVVLREAVRRGHLARNPCEGVRQLPVDPGEIDYLRLSEIEGYLAACAGHYRILAAFLIGSGTRVSEAVNVRWEDLDLSRGALRVYRQRSRTGRGTARTKGKRFRGVQIGPRLSQALAGLSDQRREQAETDNGWVFLCPRPKRGRYARRTALEPPHRRSFTSGMKRRSSTPGCETCPSTASATPQRPLGLPPAIPSSSSSASSAIAPSPPPKATPDTSRRHSLRARRPD